MIGIILGILTIGLGLKAFSPSGLPVTKEKNLTGTKARVIGIICILLGVFLIVDGVFGTMRIVSMFRGAGEPPG